MAVSQTSQQLHTSGLATWAARLGTICYIIWSFLHLQAAWAVYHLGQSLPPSMNSGRVLQDAWNLAFFSIFGFATAVALNWRNNAWGYWINLAIISVADIGFIMYVLVPGFIPIWPGIAGPAFWVPGLLLTTIGHFSRSPR
ncbi:hypothetical protein ACELLULO517_22305 [Acidisoma cellulosilytica]|uniref:Uncharacterized protein n=1 Tax=Acidisoma cellulosilyticum TaxID=2802395 RepID=A0A963Z562_9PROT|nr:hypothetical protein [Acidisoma cellulosilyticum]MCB8882997.1 hypothetical protein [Acidisoma cellulosilyticum]